jgi:hypothetical protein
LYGPLGISIEFPLILLDFFQNLWEEFLWLFVTFCAFCAFLCLFFVLEHSPLCFEHVFIVLHRTVDVCPRNLEELRGQSSLGVLGTTWSASPPERPRADQRFFHIRQREYTRR